MSRFVELISSRHAPHFVVLALVSVGFGGCSADTSTRFQDNPFASRETTGTVQQNSDRQNGYYQQNYSQQQPPRELPQYRRPYATAPVVSAPLSYPTASTPTSGGGRGMASYTPPAAPIETTGSTAPRSVAAAVPGWHREGGTTIIVGTADTLDVISKRYNVPSSEILKANGYNGPRMLQPGQQLVIPRRTANAAPPALSPAPSTKVAAALPASVHVVKPGDTLMNLSRRHNIPPAQLAAANHIPVTTQLKIGTKINIPGGGKVVASAAPQMVAEAPKPVAVAAAPVAPAAKPVVVARVEPVQKARVAAEAPAAELPEAQSPVKAAEATNALPTFRWPVRGRVITAYGAKTNGKQNDGINVAVPEGTPVKAAEDGVVAYSGNELKGYGNLILVRHSNGYVTAYAHASELMVKRGDTIKRGQVIAKSGQTGEVGSPQLHFEIRKGSSAVDPLQFLNGA